MIINVCSSDLIACGVQQQHAQHLIDQVHLVIKNCDTPAQSWQLTSQVLSKASYPFNVHLYLFALIFPHWKEHPETAPAWIPADTQLTHANISRCMKNFNINSVQSFHQWTTKQYQEFWQYVIQELNIVFKQKPYQLCDLSLGLKSPQWFPGGLINIVDSCFTAPPSNTALIYQDEQGKICRYSYEELDHLSNRVANSLVSLGYTTKDVIGMIMPMNISAVAIYLGIIKMGGIVVSIADSFSNQEIAIRLKIANAKAVFTQDFILWGGKRLPLYEKIQNTHPGKTIVLSHYQFLKCKLAEKDLNWNDFLVKNTNFVSIPCQPMMPCHILFSSGTTAQPKAIPWNHTTPIKSASDAYFHHNIQANDVLAWPTNLGWMMGPWLIYAAFINQASIALYPDTPKDRPFGEFI